MDFTFGNSSEFKELNCDIDDHALDEFAGYKNKQVCIKIMNTNKSLLAEEIKQTRYFLDVKHRRNIRTKGFNRYSLSSAMSDNDKSLNCAAQTRNLKEEITYLLRLMASKRKQSEDELHDKNQNESNFVSMRDVLSAE